MVAIAFCALPRAAVYLDTVWILVIAAAYSRGLAFSNSVSYGVRDPLANRINLAQSDVPNFCLLCALEKLKRLT